MAPVKANRRWLFVSDNYPPETNAAASRIHERAVQLVRSGDDVTVITSCPNFPFGKCFPGYINRWVQREVIDGVKVVRVKTFISRNDGFFLRSLDFLSFVFPAFIAGLLLRKPDVVVGSCPHLLVPVPAMMIAILRRLPVITEVADIWPDSAVAVGALRQDSLLVALLRKVERWLYCRSDVVVAVTSGIAQHVQLVSKSRRPVVVIENGVDTDFVVPVPRDEMLLRATFPNSASFVLGYIGTLGVAQSMSTLVPALHGIIDVDEAVLMAGPGADRQAVESAIKAISSERIKLLPPVPRVDVPRLWALCDVAILQLRDSESLRAALPSKIVELCALGVPVIFIGPEGVASRFVTENRIGFHVLSGDMPALRRALDRIRYDQEWQVCSSAMMRSVADKYSRKRQAMLYAEVLETVLIQKKKYS